MTKLPKIATKDDAHWYRIVFENGKPTGVPVLGDLRSNAIKNDAWVRPSFTTVEKVVAAPDLERWRARHYINAAIKTQYVDGESDQQRFDRVSELAEREMSVASSFGTAFHKGADNAFSSDDPRLQQFLDFAREWYEANVEETLFCEEVIAHPSLPLAGRMDRLVTLKDGRVALIDWKTKSPYKGKLEPWPKWERQLVGYADACEYTLGITPDVIMNLIVNSETPAPVVEHVWQKQTRDDAIHKLAVITWLWFSEKNNMATRKVRVSGRYSTRLPYWCVDTET